MLIVYNTGPLSFDFLSSFRSLKLYAHIIHAGSSYTTLKKTKGFERNQHLSARTCARSAREKERIFCENRSAPFIDTLRTGLSVALYRIIGFFFSTLYAHVIYIHTTRGAVSLRLLFIALITARTRVITIITRVPLKHEFFPRRAGSSAGGL